MPLSTFTRVLVPACRRGRGAFFLALPPTARLRTTRLLTLALATLLLFLIALIGAVINLIPQ